MADESLIPGDFKHQPDPVVSHCSFRLLLYIIILFILGAIVSVIVKSTEKKALTSLVASSGVRTVKRIARTVTEIERKTFHAAGLFVPLLYNLLLSNGWTATECALMCW